MIYDAYGTYFVTMIELEQARAAAERRRAIADRLGRAPRESAWRRMRAAHAQHRQAARTRVAQASDRIADCAADTRGAFGDA